MSKKNIIKRIILCLKRGDIRGGIELAAKNKNILKTEDVDMIKEVVLLVNSRLEKIEVKAQERAKRGAKLLSEI